MARCPECEGSDWFNVHGNGKCSKCLGTGVEGGGWKKAILDVADPFNLDSHDPDKCSRCNGSGECPRCDGTGDVED